MGLKKKLFLLIIFICAGIVAILIASNMFVNRVRIGGTAYNGIDLKNHAIDLVARSRVNWNMLNSVMKTQILDEYDEDTSAPDIAEKISEAMSEMDMIFNAKLQESELGCASCHSLERAAEINEAFSTAMKEWAVMHSLLVDKILPALAADDSDTASQLFTGPYDDNYMAVMQDTKLIVDSLRTSLDSMKEQVGIEVRQSRILFISGGIACLVLILLIAGITVETIVKKIRGAVDEIDSTCQTITTESQVTTATLGNNADIAIEMAAALEETSASMEEITSMVRQNDENARDTEKKMKGNLEVIKQANLHVEGMKKSMETIKSDSDKISQIITEIDGIAFQTNLLALNAAVEAARAGEAGAGFAVVADEVRNLAQRTAESARNSQELIETAIGNVKEGLETVGKVDAAMAEISESTETTAILVEEISKASHQQTEGIAQINSATAEMESRTQGFAAGSEELAAASQAILSETNSLYGTIGDLITLVEGNKGNRSDGGVSYRKSMPNSDPTLLPEQ